MPAPELTLQGDPTPLERWGKDHWSTFAYAHTRAVDHDGVLGEQHMRDRGPYPTRLKGYDSKGQCGPGSHDPANEIQNHGDCDCLLDAQALGLLTVERAGKHPRSGRVMLGHVVTFTEKGNVLAGKLMAHKADGGNFATFEPGAALGLHVAGPAKAGAR